ncbi:hypothetical protein [Arthrobacter zhaoguopingii]|uniref:hypothetical protein n=1 Tax=Arthrobacter zhaoguopingii TaxID=2681491 RepID=UPI00135A583E|nr:hypothetical protein [Arthrobacter zhaoguopingii]
MQPLSIEDIRSSFINATRSETVKRTPRRGGRPAVASRSRQDLADKSQQAFAPV